VITRIRKSVMYVQARMKCSIKFRIIADVHRPGCIKFGIGRGIRILFNRRHDLQREFGLYEKELEGPYRLLIKMDNIIYDVGGCDGYTAIILAHLAPDGKVISFEPSPKMCDTFRRNLSLNPSLAPRVELVHAFVGSSKDTTFVQASKTVAAPTISIDDIVCDGSYPPPSFVKIDVDGAEMEVLQGMRETLHEYRPALIIETHSEELERQCIAFFTHAVHYRVRIIKNAFWRVFLPEYRPIEHNRWLVVEPD
jgi:hypothetical protein